MGGGPALGGGAGQTELTVGVRPRRWIQTRKGEEAPAFERGVPALIAWLIWLAIYVRMLWRNLRRDDLDWTSRGVLLGALGGTVGLFTSGLVHYNWGDSEVAMIFYLIMGLSLAIIRNIDERPPNAAVAI